MSGADPTSLNVGRAAGQGEAANVEQPPERVDYALLDQSLWNAFRAASDPVAYVRAWLALQCRQVPGTRAAVAVLGAPETGPFTPAATWPADDAAPPALMRAAEDALARRETVLQSAGGGAENLLALPVLVDGALYGCVALAFQGSAGAAAEATRRLRWGLGWLESLLRREQGGRDAALRDRTMRALDFVAIVLGARRFEQACTRLATELARELECDPVAVGILRRKRVRVRAVSHSADFGRRMNLVRDMGLAMDEALDQHDIVHFPPPEGWDYRVTRMHEDLALAHRTGSVLTVPMPAGSAAGDDDRMLGAITLERRARTRFSDETVELVDVIAAMVGPILEEKRRNDRSILTKVVHAIGGGLWRIFGPRHAGLKIATLVLAGLVYLAMTVTTTFAIGSPARIEGLVQRSVVAPFSGYLATESARAGDEVAAGEIIATINDQDLQLEKLRLETARRQREAEYDEALATRELATATILRRQIEQVDSQLALIEEQLARTRIRAPFDGFVVEGDLSQRVGSSLDRGQELFKIAPLDAYRVVLEVDERDIAQVEPGQEGALRLSARPGETLDYAVTRLTPIAEARDGRNFFRVEAALDTVPDWVSPAMEGAARTRVDERLAVEVWTRRFTDWLRLALWRVQP
ncbi:GAF domain protein [Oceanicola granulosus HTCC2516]|uniref:GAF domain protein n=1 Tax=Oceanicola granulosus (strain ATCC BAA-861 / DSM 15982 / KCTC 12143 / HTCC2516) TaxID=314256 RepID=Q2CHG9_OCEGH|nr:HlyD family efflux transporter periplasmic adaptor subunit [Oceanicola granulosus]EAR52070.1 GAF domain protein [Oceanicola granulosus HTCC2516]